MILKDKNIKGGDNIKCWKNWCYVIGIPYNIFYSNGTKEINLSINQNQIICLDFLCFVTLRYENSSNVTSDKTFVFL